LAKIGERSEQKANCILSCLKFLLGVYFPNSSGEKWNKAIRVNHNAVNITQLIFHSFSVKRTIFENLALQFVKLLSIKEWKTVFSS